MDKRAINNLINSYSHLDPEYGPKLTNHLPMALYALYDIDASDAQITQFAQDHIKARGLTPLTQKSTTIIDSQTYYSALGERRSFSANNQFFDKEIKWAHIDISGTCWTDKNKGVHPSGATGFGVKTIVQWIKN